jgi:hypothetical protein
MLTQATSKWQDVDSSHIGTPPSALPLPLSPNINLEGDP